MSSKVARAPGDWLRGWGSPEEGDRTASPQGTQRRVGGARTPQQPQGPSEVVAVQAHP